jgi:hypothetical protein
METTSFYAKVWHKRYSVQLETLKIKSKILLLRIAAYLVCLNNFLSGKIDTKHFEDVSNSGTILPIHIFRTIYCRPEALIPLLASEIVP